MYSRSPRTLTFQTTTKTKNNNMRILGVDPGFAQTGWGVVDVVGGRFRPVSFGVVKTTTAQEQGQRIHEIAVKLGEVALQHNVQCVSMEDIFFAKNVSSAITVAKVIGAITHQFVGMGLAVRMFSPMQIKTTVSGYGLADKHQVQEMIRLMLGLQEIPKPDHAADALAAAICLGTFGATELKFRT